MRKLSILILTILLSITWPSAGQALPGVSAENAVLIEQSTGRILFEKAAHEKQSIASITKIMTAIIAIESRKMDERATASREAVYTEGSSIYLEEGEKMTIKDLVYGLMLRSGNDAAVTIAEHIGGSVEGFVYLMNEKADWLGMTNTNFENPHGLDSEKHYSSAYDMALLMRYAMDNDIFREISGTERYKSENRTYYWQNKNKLLTKYYEYCTGGKTGYTKKTGRTLVTTAKKNGMELIAVTLNAPDDWNDHIHMYEYGFDQYDLKSLSEEGKKYFNILDWNTETAGYHREVIYPLTEEEVSLIKKKNFLLANEGEKGEIIGRSVFYLNDEEIANIPIYREEKKEKEASFFMDTLNVLKKVIGMQNG